MNPEMNPMSFEISTAPEQANEVKENLAATIAALETTSPELSHALANLSDEEITALDSVLNRHNAFWSDFDHVGPEVLPKLTAWIESRQKKDNQAEKLAKDLVEALVG